jgi:hypothetical protein
MANDKYQMKNGKRIGVDYDEPAKTDPLEPDHAGISGGARAGSPDGQFLDQPLHGASRREQWAEVPTFREMASLDADGNKEISATERDAYLRQKVAELTPGQGLTLNGQPVSLSVVSSDLQIRPGAGNLPTLLITINYRATLGQLFISHCARRTTRSMSNDKYQMTDGKWSGLQLHQHEHRHESHGEHAHLHFHVSGTHHHHDQQMFKTARRPLLVGMVHGLAGSAALVLLALTTMPSVLGGLLYILAFGIGSIAGMLVMSSLISVPFVFSARASSRLNQGIRVAAGLFSVVFGLLLAWRIGVVERLFF